MRFGFIQDRFPRVRRVTMPNYNLRRPHLGGVLKSSPLTVLKAAEVKLLGKKASTYCYNYPAVYQIEITNRCNLNCGMCPRIEELKAKGYTPSDMTLETLKRIVMQIKGVYHISLFGRGEPLLHKDLIPMIKLLAERNVPQISTTTNGLLLHGNRAEELASSKLTELRVSIDGPDEETYRSIRNADFDKLVANVRSFTSLSTIPVTVNFVLGRTNWDAAPKMPELVHSLGARCLRVFNAMGYRDSVAEMVVGVEHMEKNYQNLKKELKRRCDNLGIAFIIDNLRMTNCLWPFIMAFIDIEGYITPCCRLEHLRLSNVYESGLFAVWNDKKMRDWRKKLLEKNYPKICYSIHCA